VLKTCINSEKTWPLYIVLTSCVSAAAVENKMSYQHTNWNRELPEVLDRRAHRLFPMFYAVLVLKLTINMVRRWWAVSLRIFKFFCSLLRTLRSAYHLCTILGVKKGHYTFYVRGRRLEGANIDWIYYAKRGIYWIKDDDGIRYNWKDSAYYSILTPPMVRGRVGSHLEFLDALAAHVVWAIWNVVLLIPTWAWIPLRCSTSTYKLCTRRDWMQTPWLLPMYHHTYYYTGLA
jgi:hypothetical protein